MVRIGMIGFSDGNGHPYSFSAIINGYNRDAFLNTEWLGILNYLEKREANEFCSLNAKVTYVWTQHTHLSEEIAKCCNIENVVNDYMDMVGMVDAVIIARDDYHTHKELSSPFLENNIPVFIDKPLTLNADELDWYKPYYDRGLVMSCSGFRYCNELFSPRNEIEKYGDVRLVRAAVINEWEKYGIHMLDAALGIWDQDAQSVHCVPHNNYDSYHIEFENEVCVQIDTLGPEVITFSFEIFGTKQCEKFEIRDNFSSFKNTLELFIKQVNTRCPAISWESMQRSISILIAGKLSKEKQKKIFLGGK